MRQATTSPSARAEIRPWPLDADLAQLVIADVAMVPTTGQVEQWVAEAYDAPFGDGYPSPLALRTGALYPAAAAAFIDSGFDVVDRLALLERALHEPMPRRRHTASDPASLRRMRRRDLPMMATIDQMAFSTGWRNDERTLADISAATPRTYRRVAVTSRNGAQRHLGFQITGMAGATGYIQRLAVRPDAWGLGVGRRLVDDALGWLTRRGANRVLVNTGIDNVRALRLYRAAAFEILDQQLVVLEHRRAT